MLQILDSDPNSNDHFFLTGITNDRFKAGKNSFRINVSPTVLDGKPSSILFYDSNQKSIPIQALENGMFSINISESTTEGLGLLEIKGRGLFLGQYTGSFAFYNNKAYPISKDQRLPLLSAPNAEPFPEATIIWSRNIYIDPTEKNDSEVTFFDSPYINVESKIFSSPIYPASSYLMASGAFSATAVSPRNNDRRKNFITDAPIYQLNHAAGSLFSSSMEGEKIRIKFPKVKNFTYSNYSNNQITYDGNLNTDFIATITKVINDKNLLINIPFSTVSELVGRSNEDSPYNVNNLVDIHGYTVNDDPQKQSTSFKNNFYVLSIPDANFEIIYKNISTNLPRLSASSSLKSVVNIEFNNLRSYSGHISSYKIYGRSLNFPESKTVLASGKIESDEHLISKNFNNSLYDYPGKFFNQTHTNRFWVNSGTSVFTQDHSVLIDGVKISHAGNLDQTNFVIFKDDTTVSSRTANYIDCQFVSGSYWYAKSDAFTNSAIQPSSSYSNISNIPLLSNYKTSQENIISGSIHDSNPIKLRKSTLYSFTMNVVPSVNNTNGSILYVYFVSKNYKKQIGIIDSTFKSQTNLLYKYTFFSEIERYGTIMLVPVSGEWNISALSIKPYQSLDYSLDSFSVQIPVINRVRNELFEIEAELYDNSGKIAYGKGSNAFRDNPLLVPLRKEVFVDPNGSTVYSGGGGSGTSGTSGISGGGGGTSGTSGYSGTSGTSGGGGSGTSGTSGTSGGGVGSSGSSGTSGAGGGGGSGTSGTSGTSSNGSSGSSGVSGTSGTSGGGGGGSGSSGSSGTSGAGGSPGSSGSSGTSGAGGSPGSSGSSGTSGAGGSPGSSGSSGTSGIGGTPIATTGAQYARLVKNISGTISSASDTKWVGANVFNVKDYGAVGDGSTDDTAAIQSAVNAALSSTVTGYYCASVYIPAGVYYISDAIAINMTIPGGIRIYGEGFGVTRIGQYTNNKGIFAVSQSNASAMFTIEGLTFVSEASAGAGSFPLENPASCVKITHTSSGGGASHDNFHAIRCQFSSNAGAGQKYFRKQVEIVGQSGYNHFIHCRFCGSNGDHLSNTNLSAIYMSGTMQLGTHIVDCNFGFFYQGVYVYNNAQDVSLTNCYFVNMYYGIRYKQNCVFSAITSCGFDTHNYSIYAEGNGGILDQLQLTTCNFYFQENNQVTIYGQMTRSTIIGSLFINSFSKSSVIGIQFTNGSSNNIVSNCIFQSTGGSYAANVRLDSGVSNCSVRDISSDTNLNCIDNGSGNYVGNTIGMTSVVSVPAGDPTTFTINVDITKAGLGKVPEGLSVGISNQTDAGATYDYDSSTKTSAVIKFFRYNGGSFVTGNLYRYNLKVGP